MSGERLTAAMDALAGRTGAPVEVALILGSGLGGLADAVEVDATIPYGEIRGLPVATAPGHAGQLVIGRLAGRRVALMQGRLHLYEGLTPADIALSVRILRRLGAGALVVTNAAGALDPGFVPGDIMLIEDHLNLTGANPLIGRNDPSIGLRFPDMSRAYDPAYRDLARAVAAEAGIALRTGIYAGVTGPSLETSAERRCMQASGAQAVGMSTVHEVIAAVHCGLRVLAFSAITNEATGGPDQGEDTIERVLERAEQAGKTLGVLLERLLPAL
ncbi:MAG: purine-nucleoside phosphorylase [Amaricoccus sp.]|uniref:purine-nucleoside phosphorylase n=1 Tax=Amaricoccus sp. TaxID=1872485 RepID=UPI0039E45B58